MFQFFLGLDLMMTSYWDFDRFTVAKQTYVNDTSLVISSSVHTSRTVCEVTLKNRNEINTLAKQLFKSIFKILRSMTFYRLISRSPVSLRSATFIWPNGQVGLPGKISPTCLYCIHNSFKSLLPKKSCTFLYLLGYLFNQEHVLRHRPAYFNGNDHRPQHMPPHHRQYDGAHKESKHWLFPETSLFVGYAREREGLNQQFRKNWPTLWHYTDKFHLTFFELPHPMAVFYWNFCTGYHTTFDACNGWPNIIPLV